MDFGCQKLFWSYEHSGIICVIDCHPVIALLVQCPSPVPRLWRCFDDLCLLSSFDLSLKTPLTAHKRRKVYNASSEVQIMAYMQIS